MFASYNMYLLRRFKSITYNNNKKNLTVKNVYYLNVGVFNMNFKMSRFFN